MPFKCAVPTCSSSKGSRSLFKNRVSYFSTPKDPMLLAEWESNLHLLDGQHLSSKSKICQLHFSESDIIKGKTVKKNGKDCFISHRNWILKPNALPSIENDLNCDAQTPYIGVHIVQPLPLALDLPAFIEEEADVQHSLALQSLPSSLNGMNNINCEAEIHLNVVEELGTDKSTSKGCACTCTCGKLGLTNTGFCTIQEQHGEKRSLVIDNLPSETYNAAKRICLDDATVSTATEQQAQLQVATAEQILNTIVSSSYFRANEAVLKIPLPPAWFWVKAAIAKGWTCNEFVSDDIFTATCTFRKRMTVNFEKLQVDYSVYGMECQTQDLITKSFTNISELCNAIIRFHGTKVCLGSKMDNLDTSSLAEIKGGILKHGTWRATSCQLLLANGRRNTCTSCLSLLNGTRKRLKRLAFRKRQLQNAHYRFQTKQQLIQRLRLQSLKLNVARRKVKRAKLSNKSLKKKMKQLEEKFDVLDHSKVEMLIKDDVQLTDSVN